MKCSKCQFWGEGDGKGFPYDAGHMNYCQNHQIDGLQHPSLNNTMLYANSRNQHILTRHNFGCILFEPIYIKMSEINES